MEKKKINSLQALRAFAFLGVFSLHIGWADLGAWGVSIFFVLSGFLMMYTYSDRDIKYGSLKENLKFSIKKIKKLYPLHIITMFVAAAYMVFDKFINHTLDTQYLAHIVKTAVLVIPLLQTWVPKMYVAFALNGPSWYLSVCLFLYFCFPLIHRLIKKYVNAKNVVGSLLIVLTVQTILAFTVGRLNMPETYTNEWSKWFTYIFPVFRLGDFIIGCLAGSAFLLRTEKQTKNSIFKATIFEILVVLLSVCSVIIYYKLGSRDYEWLRYSTIYIVPSLALVWAFAFNKGWITRLFTNRITVWIGNMSPYAFLIHQVVICWFNYLLRSIFGDISLIYLGAINLTITLILSSCAEKIKHRRKVC